MRIVAVRANHLIKTYRLSGRFHTIHTLLLVALKTYDVLHALEACRSPILLTERKERLECFAKRLQGFTRNLIVLKGGRGNKNRRDDLYRLAAIPDDEERLVLATGRYIEKGFDDARLDTLFLALPVSSKGTLIQ